MCVRVYVKKRGKKKDVEIDYIKQFICVFILFTFTFTFSTFIDV